MRPTARSEMRTRAEIGFDAFNEVLVVDGLVHHSCSRSSLGGYRTRPISTTFCGSVLLHLGSVGIGQVDRPAEAVVRVRAPGLRATPCPILYRFGQFGQKNKGFRFSMRFRLRSALISVIRRMTAAWRDLLPLS